MAEAENKQWIEQVQKVAITPGFIIGLGLWFLLITPITIFLGVGAGVIALAIFFSLIWLYPYWQPVFQIAHFISGRKEVPHILEKHQLKYFHYISLGIKIVVLLFLYYEGLRVLFEKGFGNLLR